MEMATILSLAFLVLVIVTLAKTARIVPQRSAFIVERLGKYAKTLEAGFHLLIPFVDRVSYKHTLKEEAIDVPSQACVTRDNIQVVVDGVLYLQVVDPKLASYGINDYRYASMQLAQTTLRSVVGKIDLDKTFEERETINVRWMKRPSRGALKFCVTRLQTSNCQQPSLMRWKNRCVQSVNVARSWLSLKVNAKPRSMYLKVRSRKPSTCLKLTSSARLTKLKVRPERSN